MFVGGVALTHFQGLAPNRLLGGSSSTIDGDVTPNVNCSLAL
jgi:hypothetical protein